MLYRYEELSPEQFEKLIVILCQKLLGISTKGFAKGPDGGRDAKFHGTAELFPSIKAPWEGKVIIQAKHTSGYNHSFSENHFYNPESKNNIIGKELPRILKLKENNDLDYYMLFSNRRLSGDIDSEITKFLSGKTGLSERSIYLCGVEQLELWLREFSDVAEKADIDPIDCPLNISPNDLSEIVQAIAKQIDPLEQEISQAPIKRTSFHEKNKLNNMSEDYAEEIRKRYLPYFKQIKDFLAAPENLKILLQYEEVVDDFQRKIISKRKDYHNFDSVMNYLIDMLFERDPILRQKEHKRLTKILLFYMYYSCDIGKSNNAHT